MLKTVAILVISAWVTAGAQQGPSSGAESSSTPVPGYPASLQVKGTVSLNQRSVTDVTSTVISGDRIETGPAAAARISAPGLSIYVPENSCLKYNGQDVDLCNCGSVDVNSVRPVSVRFRVRELVVSSQGQSSAFAVSVSGSDLEVSNHQGAMAITKGGSVLTTLSSSVSKSFAGLGCADPSVSHTTAKRRTAAAGTAAAGTATAWTLAALSAPAALSAAMLARSSNRAPLSSLKP